MGFWEGILFLCPAFGVALILLSVHTYLGMHVLERGIIFVDLAMAQLAALGMAVALLLDVELNNLLNVVISIGFTTAGAMLMVWFSRLARKKILPEALIGMVYVGSSALMLLILDAMPHGGHHTQAFLIGSLLWNTWQDILFSFFIYGGAFAILYMLHDRIRQHALLSADKVTPKLLAIEGTFYMVFGIVVTFSVRSAGLLVVFAMLVSPALFSGLFAGRFLYRFLIGWLYSFMVVGLSLAASYLMDLPAGAFMVSLFVGVFLLTLAAKSLRELRA